ncbi:hypothetical protein [Streptomyces sp. NPDC003247]|uniref:hypothetical protein n=1 Tax=Streptomyces sp. NPDC003247 TaxID=3364677 RepID=UPI0036A772A8
MLEERAGRPRAGPLAGRQQVFGVVGEAWSQAAAGPERRKNVVARGSAQPASSRTLGLPQTLAGFLQIFNTMAHSWTQLAYSSRELN